MEADEAEEIDDENWCLPGFYKRIFQHPPLKLHGFYFYDYEYCPVGTTGRINLRYADYIIFPVVDRDTVIGYDTIPGQKKR
ncbi:MAG: hypothetical protein ACLUH6_05975 [Bacteroides faecis]|uniref:hypothetical protein n=1 Tax=Bacteroides faecis TaxID=674529 RepID=UPI003A1B930B